MANKQVLAMQTIIQPKIPKAILEKHPELEPIILALEQYQNGNPITAKCTTCNGTLMVKDIPAVGAIWVVCDKGCTSYREKRAA